MSGAHDAHGDLATELTGEERRVVYLMAGVQFVNLLDFLMVNPLGPQFAEALHVSMADLPLVAGAYTAAASVTGILGALFLERFDRRTALTVSLVGLAIGTALGGAATGFTTLLLSRVIAGLFGGPATSVSFAIIADKIPAVRRGKAMGIVMGGFALASVVGVPAGLAFASVGGWRAPFFGVGALIIVGATVAATMLPKLRAHLEKLDPNRNPVTDLFAILKKRLILTSLGMSVIALMSSFVLVPNFAAFTQFNLGFPGNRLFVLYLVGGIASLITSRFGGGLVDRYGSTKVATFAALFLIVQTFIGFVLVAPWAPVLVISTSFFIGMSLRTVSYNTLTSKVPDPHERARFQSIQSAVGHAATSCAAFFSSKVLDADESTGKLLHFERVAYTSIALTFCVPIIMLVVERRVRAKLAAEAVVAS